VTFNLNKRVLVGAVALGLGAIAQGAAANAGLVAKQLAGAPEEFAAMAAIDPADAAIISKSALIEVDLAADKRGGLSWEGNLPVENGALRFLVFSAAGQDWQAELISPAGTVEKSRSDLARSVKRSQFGIEQAQLPANEYTVDGLANGELTLKLQASGSAGQRGYVLIEGDDTTELASYQSHSRQRVGERIGLLARLGASDSKGRVLLGNAAGSISRAEIKVTYPNGSAATVGMFDDGLNDDGLAGDGLFGGSFVAKSAGDYLAQVVVHGRNAGGQSLLRTAEHAIPVVEASLVIDASQGAAKSRHSTDGRVQIAIPVRALSSQKKGAQHYRAYAEVWGVDSDGNGVPVAWIGGMVEPKDGALGLGLDSRWVQRAGASAPFELRNLRVEDADAFVTVASQSKMALDLALDFAKSGPAEIAIDETMSMGPRPNSAQQKGVGKRLLLVHGYCSGGVWPASQFSTASTFLDANQNRSHDQFARLIQSFGSTWNSFGVVAHSQGGAASLHLYTYYWSGLDNATGSRLIQSVGTPYQGTNLSGILAALGNWFGVGCGTNNNLTYSGASSWLAGIPTSARAKVNYYTTAFRTTNWWTNDYCNFATDLVLSDPEDGTTERAYGQLPGAVNRGHTTGQCHTAGMRDPAQYQDASRNSVMNSNAAR